MIIIFFTLQRYSVMLMIIKKAIDIIYSNIKKSRHEVNPADFCLEIQNIITK